MANRRTSQRRFTVRKKLLFATIATAGFFGMLELCLLLVGVSPVTATRDPFVGFAAHNPLFVETEEAEPAVEWMTTSPAKLVWFNAQSFPRHKRARVRRVFCLGGSTTYGRPFSDSTSFAGWLRELLPVVDDGSKWEVINAGGVSYASYRVAAVMEELVDYQPDLFVIYSVHNEFLERRTYAAMFQRPAGILYAQSLLARTRTWTLAERLMGTGRSSAFADDHADDRAILPAEVDERLNHTVGPVDYHRDDAWRARVLQHYELNLNRIVAAARRANAGVLLVTPASNEKDCSPFKSELNAELSTPQTRRFWQLFADAETDQQAGKPEKALATFGRARDIDKRHALLHFRIGLLEAELQRHDDAEKSFAAALNEDVCPLRAVDEVGHTVRRVARRSQLPLVDFEQLLRDKARSERGRDYLGEEYFLDHVHPTLDVHRQLALWILDEMLRAGLRQGRAPSNQDIAAAQQRIDAQVDEPARGVALRNLAKVLHWSGKFAEAAPRAREALELLPEDSESMFVLGDCLVQLGQTDEAQRLLERVLQLDPDFSRAYIPLGRLLAEQGDLRAAKIQLAMGALLHPRNASGHYLLGIVHLRLGEFELAREALAVALKLTPQDANTRFYLAQAEMETGELDSAIKRLEKLLEAGQDAELHFWLGEALQRQDRTAAARQHWRAALQLDPSHAGATNRLAPFEK